MKKNDKVGKGALPPPKSAAGLADMYFLDARSAALEVAALLDRLERADGGTQVISEDPRVLNLRQACRIIADEPGPRVEKILRLLSV